MEIATQWGGMPTIFTAGKLVLTADILWYVLTPRLSTQLTLDMSNRKIRNMATLTIKMSILHLYISVFGLVSKPFRQAVWIVMGICVLSTVVFIIQILVLCRPLAYFWDKSIAGTCGSLNLTYLIPGIIITVEDLVVFTLPMPMLWKLKMERKKKLGTMFVFGIGFGICMMSGVRLKYVVELKTEDFTESIWEFAILGTLEPMFGIISACLPVIPAVVSHYSSGRMMAWSTKGGSGHGTGKSGLASKGLSSTSGHSAHADFQRLSDHEYPLIEQVKPASHAQSEVVGDDWQTHNTGAPGGNIMVTKQFTVDSREGSGRGKKEDV
jgi:hypothetical protein